MGIDQESRPAVFLDRDGTLIEEVDHLARPEDLRLFSFTSQALTLLKRHGYLLIVVTNQSGIGRGYFSESNMNAVHAAIDASLPGMLDRYYFCPHLPDTGCSCRKPGTGMFASACQEYQIDMNRSWMIGDKKIDIEAGTNAGVRSILTLTGYGISSLETIDRSSALVAADLLEAARLIVGSTH